MAVVSAAILIVLRHRWTLWPKSLIVVAFATAGTAALGLDVPTVGDLPSNLFSFSTDFLSDFSTVAVIIPPAISIAVLAALESLLSAKVADKIKGDGSVHDSDKELVGQGLANLATPLFGGVPATAALARTAVNVHAGARTRLAAVSHSVVLALAVLLFASQVALIPIPALAGVLWATTAQMIKISELRVEANASHLDALILLMTLVLTVVLDLIVAVAVGTMLWLALRNRLTSGREPLVNDDETFGD
jgi:SulP family sulfate permease